MKPAGALCNVDNLGRIVIPKHLRQAYDLDKGTTIELFRDDNGIMLKKYRPSCIFCGNIEDVSEYKGVKVCKECIEELTKKI